jgi:hypothetical protein
MEVTARGWSHGCNVTSRSFLVIHSLAAEHGGSSRREARVNARPSINEWRDASAVAEAEQQARVIAALDPPHVHSPSPLQLGSNADPHPPPASTSQLQCDPPPAAPPAAQQTLRINHVPGAATTTCDAYGSAPSSRMCLYAFPSK